MADQKQSGNKGGQQEQRQPGSGTQKSDQDDMSQGQKQRQGGTGNQPGKSGGGQGGNR